MKTLTIKQPYAHLIACGIKDIENRSWQTKYRGRILIHAAATEFKGGWDALTQSQKHEARHTLGDKVNLSAIIGTVEIVDCVKNHPSIWANEGEWNWVLANPVLFDEPILNVKGKLSLWEYTGELPSAKSIHESILHTDAKMTTHLMLNKLTLDETMQIAFVPLIIAEMAWKYGLKAVEQAKDDRVESVKKLCRRIKTLRGAYNADIRKDLRYDSFIGMGEQANQFLDEIYIDMLKLFFAVNNEFKRAYPNEKWDKMRSYALISEKLIDVLDHYNKEMDVFLNEKLNREVEPTKINRMVEDLRTAMVEMSSVGKEFNFENQSIQIGLNVILKRIKEMEFVLV